MIKDLTGQRFGNLTAISPVKTGSSAKWLCRCDCGNETTVWSYDLQSGHTVSCGCIKRKTPARYVNYESVKKENQRLYNIWSGMKQRCYNPKSKSYHNYGERGIAVSQEWKNSFSAFLSWANANGYSETLTLDRIDPNGNYCPENCRWIPLKEQPKNTRFTYNNRMLTINGTTKSIDEWAKEANIQPWLLGMRVNRGMKESKLLLPPIDPHFRRRKEN